MGASPEEEEHMHVRSIEKGRGVTVATTDIQPGMRQQKSAQEFIASNGAMEVIKCVHVFL